MDKGSGAVRRVPFWRSLQTKFALTYIVIVAAVLISVVYSFVMGLSQEQFSTLCVILTCVSGVNLVIRLSIPFNPIRVGLLVVILAGLILGIFVFGPVFLLTPFSFEMVIVTIILGVMITVLFNLLFNGAIRREKRYLASFGK